MGIQREILGKQFYWEDGHYRRTHNDKICCEHVGPNEGYRCTRHKNHKGKHRADYSVYCKPWD